MNGREALRALADGKRVRRSIWPPGEWAALDAKGRIVDETGARVSADVDFAHEDWSLVEEPATDEELIAEMERLASNMDNYREESHYRQLMLRERKVMP